jgi:Sulfotransferase domain
VTLFGTKIGGLLKGIKSPAPAPGCEKQPPPETIPDGLTPITQFVPEDIFVVSYPKSGNTWFQNLVCGVVYGVDPSLAPSTLVHDLVPDLVYKKYYRRYATPMFFKSHSLPRADFRRVVYLLRDGRDAMVSYRHYREVIDGVKYDLLKFISPKTKLYPCHWAEHVEAWMPNPYCAEMLVIKYEDLLSEPVRELKRFCQFFGIHRGTDHLTAVAKAASFCNLRAKEERMGFGRPDHVFPPGKFFFRRGVAGSYKDEMPPAVLRKFLERSGDTLRRFGYAVGQPEEENRQLAETSRPPRRITPLV